MTLDHDRVEELLAGHVLGGLEGDDAEVAERTLAEHVPGCPRCRDVLAAYRAVAGDLALLATPVEPPDTLRARLRRSTGRRAPGRIFRTGWSVAAAAVVAALSLTGWNVALSTRVDDAETRLGRMADAFTAFAGLEEDTLSLRGSGPARVTLLPDPAEGRIYFIATHLPEVDGVYTVWLLRDGHAWSPGTLEPSRGVDMMGATTDLDRWDVVMVTVEAERGRPSPAASPLVSAPIEDV
jgi:hypothetical protein